MNDDENFVGKDLPIDIVTDDNGIESIPQTQFIDSLVESIIQYTENNKLIVKDIRNNSIIIETEDGTETINISDVVDPEILLICYILVGAFNFSTPKIIFNLSFEDSSDELIVDSIGLGDFSGIMFMSETTIAKSDFTMEVGCRYLFNRLRKFGVFSFSFTDDQVKDRLTVDSVMVYSSSDDAVSDDSLQKLESMPTVGSVARDDRKKLKRLKRIKMNRLKDPAAYRARSRAAKLAWRSSRTKHLQGMRKFHRSAKGKRIDRMRGRKLSIKARMN